MGNTSNIDVCMQERCNGENWQTEKLADNLILVHQMAKQSHYTRNSAINTIMQNIVKNVV